MDTTRAPMEAWRDRAQPGERAYWEGLSWQSIPVEQRRSEWARHLNSLGLSLDFEGQDVVDIGCGPIGVAWFIKANRRVGVDPLAHTYEQWNGQFTDPIELVTSPGEDIALPDGAFDTAFCINCLDHVFDADRVIAELGRLVKPGGQLVLMVDFDSPLRRLHKRVKPEAGHLHPLNLTYDWLMKSLERDFVVRATRRDPETFKPRLANMRYEAYWDGLIYRLTGSKTWMHHLWVRAERR